MASPSREPGALHTDQPAASPLQRKAYGEDAQQSSPQAGISPYASSSPQRSSQAGPFASPSPRSLERKSPSPVQQAALEGPRASSEYVLPNLPTVAAAAFSLPEAGDLQEDLLSTSSSTATLESASSLETLTPEHSGLSPDLTPLSSIDPSDAQPSAAAFEQDSQPSLGSVGMPGAWTPSAKEANADAVATWPTSRFAGTGSSSSAAASPGAAASAWPTSRFTGEGSPSSAAESSGRWHSEGPAASLRRLPQPERWDVEITAATGPPLSADVWSAGPASSRSAGGEDSFIAPSAWGRTAEAGPEIVRTYAACAVCWCIVDGEGFVGVFPAAVQLHWWHGVHRIVDQVVKQWDLCQADGGHRGFCIVSGVQAADSWRNARKGVQCAVQLMAALRQVRLPHGDLASVRIGIHFGPAADGIVGTNRTLHYQMVGPTVETAKQISMHADANQMLASQDLFRALPIWQGEDFEFSGGPIVPLSHTREVQAHAYAGTMPEVLPEVRKMLDLMHARVSAALPPGFTTPALGRASQAQDFLGSPSYEADGPSTSRIAAEPYATNSGSQEFYPRATCSTSHQADGDDVSDLKSEFKAAPQGQGGTDLSRSLRDEQHFAESWIKGQRWLDVVSNVCLVISVVCWLMARPDSHLSTGAASADKLVLVFALSFATLSFLPLFNWRLRPYEAGFIRTCRVLVLLYNEYQTIASTAKGHLSWVGHIGVFVLPMVGISLMEGNLLRAHIAADAVVALVSLVMLPFVWHASDFLTTLGFAVHVVLGLVIPTVLLSNMQQRARYTFICSLRTRYFDKADHGDGMHLGHDVKGKGKVA